MNRYYAKQLITFDSHALFRNNRTEKLPIFHLKSSFNFVSIDLSYITYEIMH